MNTRQHAFSRSRSSSLWAVFALASFISLVFGRHQGRPLDGSDNMSKVIPHSGKVSALTFSPDDGVLVSADSERVIRVIDWKAARLTASIRTEDRLTSLAFSLDGRTLVAGGWQDNVYLFELSKLKAQHILKHPHTVYCVAHHPKEGRIGSACFDGNVRIWSVETRKLELSLGSNDEPVYALAFSPDGTVLASVGWDKSVRLWDSRTGRLLTEMKGHAEPIYCVAFSKDGRFCATGGGSLEKERSELMIWDVKERKLMRTLKGHAGVIHGVAFAPHHELLVSVGGNQYERVGEVVLWELRDRITRRRLEGHKDMVTSVVFSSKGDVFATGSRDKTLRVWSINEALKKKGDLQ